MDATISSKIEVRLIILLVGYHQMMIRWELTCDALKQEKSVDSSSSTGALSMLLKKRCELASFGMNSANGVLWATRATVADTLNINLG
jgi:hypothetical protein